MYSLFIDPTDNRLCYQDSNRQYSLPSTVIGPAQPGDVAGELKVITIAGQPALGFVSNGQRRYCPMAQTAFTLPFDSAQVPIGAAVFFDARPDGTAWTRFEPLLIKVAAGKYYTPLVVKLELHPLGGSQINVLGVSSSTTLDAYVAWDPLVWTPGVQLQAQLTFAGAPSSANYTVQATDKPGNIFRIDANGGYATSCAQQVKEVGDTWTAYGAALDLFPVELVDASSPGLTPEQRIDALQFAQNIDRTYTQTAALVNADPPWFDNILQKYRRAEIGIVSGTYNDGGTIKRTWLQRYQQYVADPVYTCVSEVQTPGVLGTFIRTFVA